MTHLRGTAQETYEFRRKQVTGQLEKLNTELGRLDEEHAADPKNWAIVGDLGKVHESLYEALESVTPENDEIF